MTGTFISLIGSDLAENQFLVTDPRGILTQYYFDLLGRKNQEIQASTGGSPATGVNVTNYTYVTTHYTNIQW